jgi:Carboxypeptidase regulatory-like domain/TonB dependent receptor
MSNSQLTEPRPFGEVFSNALDALSSAAKIGIALLAIVAFFASSATAQLAGKGAIKGVVTDPSGAVIPNATVIATSPARGVNVTGVSNDSGEYTVSPLDPDIYTLTVSAPGFKSTTQQNVHVNALEVADVPVALTVGASTETVTVDAAPPQLETSNATLGSTMENDMYSALPIQMGAYGSPDQRRATDFAFLMPGVQGNNTTGNPTTNTGIVNGSGSRGAVSAVYVDGIPFVRAGGNGDPRFVWTAISVDAVDQFQVQTSGYSAIYEGQGIQNYTIKQGGNKYHGSVYEFFRNTALDTWGFFGPVPVTNPLTGVSTKTKPTEHSNEYGINLSGPLIPVGKWREKLFFFGNYNGFRYSAQTPTLNTFPTAAQQGGNFQGVVTGGIFDPNTQAACTANNANKPCRYRYGYGPSATPGNGSNQGNPTPNGAPIDQIPRSQWSAVALKMQSFFPAGISNALQNNYLSQNPTGLTNWSTTDRIDFQITSKDNLTLLAAIGRQASSNPVGQTTSGRNVAAVPYNYGQTYAPKTAVGVIEETHVFSPTIVNQFKYGYARYYGPTFNADQVPAYSATAMGISGTPAGAASDAFPITTFAGTNAPTNWAGTTASVTTAQNYTLLDNLQWVKGKHTLTFGGQFAWMLYNVNNATGGSSPVTLANAVTETEGLNNAFTAVANTGQSYASFLIGQIDTVSYNLYNVQQVFGTRFRAISPYVQDNWKITPKLTLDFGLRYDFFPSLTEVHNSGSFFNPNLPNPITGINGALQYTGTGANTCNCSTPVNNYYKNFGPRLGLAYQVMPRTVIRASYGVMFTHGNAVGGSATTFGGPTVNNGLLGVLTPAKFGPSTTLLSTSPFSGTNGVIPSFALAAGAASGPAFGTGNTNTAGYTTSTLGSTAYADSYLGSRAPEYINYTFGIQQQITNALTATVTYVGSQGHFLPADGTNARGFWADQLDPKYLYLGSHLADTGTTAAGDCVTYNLPCPANFNSTQQLNVALRPFPFQGVNDAFGYVANSNYNSLQTLANWRAQRGLTFTASYTWSRAIDNGGTFRSGYAIPAAYANNGKDWKADAIERSVSTSNQPQHVVVSGVWDLPFGRTIFADAGWQRAIFGGFRFSEAFQAFSGSPMAITATACPTNQALGQSTTSCPPTLNPNFGGPIRVNGKWGQGITAANTSAISYIAQSTCSTTSTPTGPFIAPAAPSGQTTCINSPVAPAYTFGNSPRTAPYNLYGPGNYNLDISLQRSIGLHWEGVKLNLRADMYNVTNHTKFAVASPILGNSAFGQVAPDTTATRKSVQLSGRIEF